VREAGFTNLVPQGRLKVVQGRVAAYFQPSLRDWSSFPSNPGQASWAKFSRPSGTEFGNAISHALFSACFGASWPNTLETIHSAILMAGAAGFEPSASTGRLQNARGVCARFSYCNSPKPGRRHFRTSP
jgi:hypothetical protein